MDQPATIGALAVAQHLGVPVAYLPEISMRRIADMYPGTAKTDKTDAFIIADAARSLPRILSGLQVSDEDEATLGILTGFDLDLPARSPRPATGSEACSLRSTRPWNESLARGGYPDFK